MLGVREKELIPGKDFTIKWGTWEFQSTTFLEHFDTENPSAHAVAFTAEGAPVGFESSFKKGSAIILGSFVGQQNYREPVDMHPLGEILARWAHLSAPALRAPALLELRQLRADKGRFIFLFNPSDKTANVEFTRTLDKPAVRIREILTGRAEQPNGSRLDIRAEMPALSVRIYRIDY
jgi:hypothetical protein